MCPGNDELADLASKIESVLNAADLSAFSEFLHPEVTWGAPGDDVHGCHNRNEVIAWYNRARSEGMAGQVTEVVLGNEALLVGLRVTGTEEAEEAGGVAQRWQVLRVRGGQVVDIRGYPDRTEAAVMAGVSS
jgi:hypothetical protein